MKDNRVPHYETWEPDEPEVWMDHSDATTYHEAKSVNMGIGGNIYIRHRYTEYESRSREIIYTAMDRIMDIIYFGFK